MIKHFLLPALMITSLTRLLSCSDHPVTPGQAGTDRKMSFPQLRYDSAALEYRLDSIHNRGLILQFTLGNTGSNNSAFQLISYAFDTLGDHNNSWMPDTLRIVQDSLPQVFSGTFVLGNTEITREQLYDVLNKPDGTRVSYDYLLLTPVVEGVFRHVVYRIWPVKNGRHAQGNNGKMQMTTPMPPSRVWND